MLCGQTGSGKSVLVDKILERYIAAHTPLTLQFILLDMTAGDFTDVRQHYPEYIREYCTNASRGLTILEEIANNSTDTDTSDQVLFICIEECDMSVADQARFDAAVIKINSCAVQSNIKLIYSTSRVARDTLSDKLKSSFDLLLIGQYDDIESYKFLGVSVPEYLKNHEFLSVVNQHARVETANRR